MEKTVVHVNGKSYDAVTGRRMTDVIAPVQKQVKKTPKPAQIMSTSVQPKPSTQHTRQAAAHTRRHAPQSAQTLMRRAVTKPKAGLKKQLHVQHELAHTVEHAIPVKHVAAHVDTARAQRAKQVEKDQQVHRFHGPAQVPVKFGNIAVQAAPQSISTHEPPVIPATVASQPADLFEQAIANATHYVDIAAHNTYFKKKARRHAIVMTSGIAVLVALGSFFTYSNTPSLQARMAGVVAGVSTSMPDFAAAGFLYEGVSGHEDRLTYRFRSELASYQLVEQQTNWSGAQMIRQISSVKANGTPNYTELSVGSMTLYKFSDSHATWVKDGIWYQIHGSQPLSDAQFTALVQNI
jgi:hypothetical protein